MCIETSKCPSNCQSAWYTVQYFGQHSTHWTPKVGKAAYSCVQCKPTPAHTNTPHPSLHRRTLTHHTPLMLYDQLSTTRSWFVPTYSYFSVLNPFLLGAGMVTRARAEQSTGRGSIPIGGRRIFNSPRRPEWLWSPSSLLFSESSGFFFGSKAARLWKQPLSRI